MEEEIRKVLLNMGLPAINGEITVGMTTYMEDSFCALMSDELEHAGYVKNIYCEGKCSSDLQSMEDTLNELITDLKNWREKHGD